ncbi:uncharacterized protein LOC133323367 [Musca vetustissima]|uniref:uncharacterized protein LOC133323367 n=1 Tax=Musca vetustissima TaxID=27455 RepID=UPI002AB7557A|nr:uncharacterized protein LOC133323367 [Musca vetustissima]
MVLSEQSESNTTSSSINLHHWRQHRREKRYLIFEDLGVYKLNIGVAFPIDLEDKRNWRTLAMAVNFQFQYNLPPKPIYWWDKWDTRSLGSLGSFKESEKENYQTDEPQLFLYQWFENQMNRRETNGRECLLKAICENAQIDVHQGLYAEILYRFLRNLFKEDNRENSGQMNFEPHRNMDSDYVDAWHMGLKGIDCQSNYPKAINCLLDKYTHVREEFMGYTRVKTQGKSSEEENK